MKQRRGITRLEVLVVFGICFFAAGLAVMALARHRETALREQCKNNLRQIGLAISAYHDASSVDKSLQRLPPSRIAEGYATWGVLLAPYLQKENPLHHWDLQQSYFAQKDEVREALLIQFFCPARTHLNTLSQTGDTDQANRHFPGGLGDYASVAGDGSGNHDNGALVSAHILDRKGDRILSWESRTGLAALPRGESYTLLVGEKHVPVGHQGDADVGDGSFYNGQHPASFSRVAGPGFPLANAIDAPFNNNFGSYHSGVCLFLFADKSVRPMTTNTDEIVLGRLARRGN